MKRYQMFIFATLAGSALLRYPATVYLKRAKLKKNCGGKQYELILEIW
ncbi:MAG: hypothetical protein IPG53_19935 [Ignavibacteriales bacterium]|nr:hypothetical protein [Ignavibacteriales bacterium]